VHHEGFVQAQDAYLSARNALSPANSSFTIAEMANDNPDSVAIVGFDMDVDSPPSPDDFDSTQG
jgi:hypothetical protein